MPHSSLVTDRKAIAVLVLLPFVLLAPLVLKFGLVTMGDHELVAKLGFLKALREGDSLFWTEALDCGTLLLGATSMPWTLGDLGFLVLAPARAHNFSVFVDLVLSGVGFFLWRTRSRNDRVPSSLLGAITYQCSLHALAQLSVGHQVVTAQYALVPWALWCLDALVESRWLAFAALFPWIIFMMAMATYPATTIVGGLVMGLYLGWRLFAEKKTWGSRALAILAFATASLLGICGAAFIYAPAFFFSKHCVMPGDLAFNIHDYANHLTLSPFCLVTLILPYLFGGTFTEPSFWANYLSPGNTGAPHEFAIYCGLLPLWLLWAHRAQLRKSREPLFWIGVAALLLLIAIGSWGGVYPILRQMPVLRNLRGSSRFVVFLPLAFACLATWGAEQYARSAERERARIFVSLSRWLLFLLFAAILWLVSVLAGDHLLVVGRRLFSSPVWLKAHALLQDRIVTAAITNLKIVAWFSLFWGVLLWLGSRGNALHPSFLCLLAAVDLAVNAWPMLWKPSGNAEHYLTEHPLSRLLKESSGADRKRFADLDFCAPHNLSLLDGTASPTGFRDFVTRWHMEFIRKANGENPETYDLYNYGLTRVSPFFSLLRVDTVLARTKAPPPPWREIAAVNGVRVYRGPAVPPEAWLPRRIIVAESALARLDAIEREVVENPTATAVIESPLASARLAGNIGVDRVQKTGPLQYEVSFDQKTTGLLCTAIGWYPEWRAFAEGKPIPTVRVNHAFLGVSLDRPVNEVTLRFVPSTHRFGIRLSVLAGAIWIFAIGLLAWITLGGRALMPFRRP